MQQKPESISKISFRLRFSKANFIYISSKLVAKLASKPKEAIDNKTGGEINNASSLGFISQFEHNREKNKEEEDEESFHRLDGRFSH